MSMAPTTDQQAQRIDLGQRVYMLGIFAILVVEAISTITNVGMWFEWTSLVLGTVACVGILYLGNWLYTGDKTALLVMRVWVAVELTLVLIAVVLLSGRSVAESVLCLVEGLAIAALGAELFAPIRSLQALLDVTPRHMGYVMKWLGSWTTTVRLYVVIFALLAIVAVARLVLGAF